MRKTQAAVTIGLSHLVLKKKLFRNRNNLVSASKVSRCIPPADFRLHERFGAVEGGDRSIGKAVAPTDGHQALLSVGWFISIPWV